MQIKDLDLNLLVAFHAIYKERHLTRAGGRLQRTPSAMSHALNRLRSFLDDPLFVRQGNEMVPTPLAEKLSVDIDTCLAILDDAFKDRTPFDPGSTECTYNIGMMDYCAFVVLPDLIPAIKSQAPNVTLQVKHLPYDKRPAAMENGEVDIIIGCQQQYSANVFQQRIFFDQDVCICRQGHPRIEKTLTFKQYVKEEFILLYLPEYDEVDFVDKGIRDAGYHLKIAMVLEHEVMIPEIISRTDYLANVGMRTADKFSKWLPINILPIPLSNPRMDIYQFWHKRNQKDAGHQWLRQKIKKVCQELTPLSSM